ncbi:hypothetical protein C6H64_09500 [Photorhabdus luminescens]|uniref:hypothetical protein n=1 Tax=Photorhabdus akhurstii TaxID=171438 RepID=UPI000CF9DA29|nr:hypothetical protein C6H64_09500 [Photorhabdus luminescens]PQQ35005.1 hypothetical protein C6H69_01980 [Photorhabdus luminescens]
MVRQSIKQEAGSGLPSYFYVDDFLNEVKGSFHLNERLLFIPVIFQVASLLAALAHSGHIVIYASGDLLPCRREAS